jgi:hypothetical protein
MSIRLPIGAKHTIYGVLLMAWCSGITFWILRTWFSVTGDFGLEPNPWQYPVLQLHGLMAFFMMISFGVMLGTHVLPAWRARPRPLSGIVFAALLGVSITTAYLLYYLGSDHIRRTVGDVHVIVGFALPIALMVHIRLMQRRTRQR